MQDPQTRPHPQQSPAGPAIAPPPGRLTIDLGAIAANYRYLTDKVQASCAIAGVVKADAYGIGMEQVVPVLERAECPLYFVATPQEGIKLRKLLVRDTPVVVLAGLLGPAEEYIQAGLLPALNSLREIEIWRAASQKFGRPLQAVIHIDTGMCRLGLDEAEAETLVREPERLMGLEIDLVMTHMACADDKRHPLTATQFERFEKFAAHFPDARRSVANSSAIFRGSAYHQDFARPGMALYGLNPTPERPNPMKPVITLEARVLQVRQVYEGDTVGYGASFTMPYDGQLATLAIGYADGLPRSGSNNLKFYWKGTPCPMRGRISMDLVTVDITAVKPQPMPGDWMELINAQQSVDDIAAACGTIGYEILTNLGPRYQRIYKNA
jgi:alanine racemase